MSFGMSWKQIQHGCEYNEYRRKPRTININGHKVPEPVREPLECDTEYYFVDLDMLCFCGVWDDHVVDENRLKRGLIHLTEDAAIAHAKALLSFTMQKVSDE